MANIIKSITFIFNNKDFFTNFFNCVIAYSHPKYIILSIIIGVILILAHVFIHECGHKIVIYNLAKKNKLFTSEVKTPLDFKNIFKISTTSNYLDFIEQDTQKYSKEIKYIAMAGTIFSTTTYITVLCLCLILTGYNIYSKAFICVYPFIFITIIEITTYILHSKEVIDETGKVISQPDRFLVKHPEKFQNIHKL